MFCSKCGSKVDDDAVYCWNCGSKIPVIEKKEEVTTDHAVHNAVNEKVYYEPPYTEQVSAGMTIAEADGKYDITKLPAKKQTGIKSVYMIDFLSRMVQKSNIPLFLYLLLNVVLIGLVVTVVCMMPVH